MGVVEEATAIIPIHKDGNKEWLDQALRSLPRGMRYIVVENEGEVGTAITTGAEKAETEWLLLMGADDAWEPEAFERLWEFAQFDADVVYPTTLHVDIDIKNVVGISKAEEFCGNRLMVQNYVPGCGLIRRSKYLEVGGTRDLDGLEDWDVWVRMFRAGARFKACPGAQYLYRDVPTSRNKVMVSELEEFAAKLKKEIVGEEPEMLATFYAQATPATSYLRCVLPARYLPGQARGEAAAVAVAKSEIVETDDDIEVTYPEHRGKAAVFQFAGDKTLALISQVMMTDGYRVLVEVDDNYLTVPQKKIRERAGWHVNIGDGMHSFQGHKWIVKNVDGVICTTDYLASQYSKVAKEVFVCPNTIDPPDWPTPQEFGEPFRIGWFAANSHHKDIKLITRSMEWASRQPGVEVFTMGLDPKWKFDYVHLGWADDLAAYRAAFQLLDVHVCPIIPDPWSLGRSDLKALEALMGSNFPILSDVSPYKNIPEDICMKVKDAKGFYESVKWCVANRDEVRQTARKGREWVIENRSTASQIHLWRQALEV